MKDVIYSINGPVVTVKDTSTFGMAEMVYVGNAGLIGEVISVSEARTTIQVYENTTVWIAEDPSNSEGIYFGPAKEITLRTAVAYEVVELYPECYPAIGNLAGISIIVKKVEV